MHILEILSLSLLLLVGFGFLFAALTDRLAHSGAFADRGEKGWRAGPALIVLAVALTIPVPHENMGVALVFWPFL